MCQRLQGVVCQAQGGQAGPGAVPGARAVSENMTRASMRAGECTQSVREELCYCPARWADFGPCPWKTVRERAGPEPGRFRAVPMEDCSGEGWAGVRMAGR